MADSEQAGDKEFVREKHSGSRRREAGSHRGSEYLAVRYIGHAEKWDEVAMDGSLEAKDCAATYKLGGSALVAATINRDLQNLKTDAEMENRRS